MPLNLELIKLKIIKFLKKLKNRESQSEKRSQRYWTQRQTKAKWRGTVVIAVKLDAQKLFMFVCGGYKKCIYSPIIFLL